MSTKTLYETTLYNALELPPELEGLEDQKTFDEFVKSTDPVTMAMVHMKVLDTLTTARTSLAVRWQTERARYLLAALHVLGIDVEGYDPDNTYWAQERARTAALKVAVELLEKRENKLHFYWEARIAEHSRNVKGETEPLTGGYWGIHERLEELLLKRSEEEK